MEPEQGGWTQKQPLHDKEVVIQYRTPTYRVVHEYGTRLQHIGLTA
jgi:hypothetical protein